MCKNLTKIKIKYKKQFFIMKIKKFDKKEKETQEISFSAKSLEKNKDEKPSIKTSIDDQEKIEKEFKKNIDKVEKFESFITVNIDHVDKIECENDYEFSDEDEEIEGDYEESELTGCGCCDDCSGEENCECGCDDCECGCNDDLQTASDFVNVLFSESLKYHLDNNKPITENIFRPGSEAFYDVIKEARQLFDEGKVKLCDIDKEIYESTEIGKFAYFNGELVPLDLPMENLVEMNEAEYKGKEVKLNYPMRGGTKKYYVYVKNPKTGKVKKISFGDVHGGLTAKVSNPKARKSFAARHKCSTKKDKTKAGYWACRINKYGHLWGGKTYPGFW
jgi:hypothetical protein